MLQSIIAKVKAEFSRELAFAHVAEISQHHRIQASPGYREAALYCLRALTKAGLPANLLSYAGDGKTCYWNYLMPGEWVCHKGELTMIYPEKQSLASYTRVPLSLIQRSASTPEGGVTAELIVLDKGDDEESYPETDFTRTIVLTDGDYNKVREWAIEKRGAIGIITDRMSEFPPVRHRYDLGDALQYTSFWWKGEEKRCFGFVISPKQGSQLRQLARELAEKGERIKLFAEVESSFFNGHIEDVTATISGSTEDEIVIVAHLCHPQPSANDNASGAGVVLETARTLKKLIDKGELPPPQRTIRFLLVPEMAGTYAYLANNEDRIARMVAALNLDMVGQNQELCKGPLLVERPPHAALSFAGDLMEAVLNAATKEVPNLAHTSHYALFKHAVTAFSGGSDHYILSDPTVGVGCPMLIQWPDKFYHTSFDTLDKVDPDMLYRVGVMTATYAYFAASAGPKETWWLGQQMLGSYSRTVESYIAEQLETVADYLRDEKLDQAAHAVYFGEQHLEYLTWLKLQELGSLERLTGEDFTAALTELSTQVKELSSLYFQRWRQACLQLERLYQITLPKPQPDTDEWRAKARNLVPKRLFRGPTYGNNIPKDQRLALQELNKQHAKAARFATYVFYWMDGKRTLEEIGLKVQHETRFCNWEYLVKLIQLLADFGYIELE